MQFKKTHLLKVLLVFAVVYVTLHIIDQQYHILPVAPHIKQIAWTIFLVSGTILLYIYAAQLRTKKPMPPDSGKLPGVQFEHIRVIDYGFNRIGDIDKLLFDYHGQSTWLHFPPHTARYVMAVAPKNTTADASFDITNRKAGDEKPIHDLIVIQTSQSSFKTGSIPPPAPANGRQIEVTGKIAEYRFDEKGSISGFVIDKYIIEIPKHMEQNIVPLLKVAKKIVVKGYERSATDGFVNTSSFVLVKPFAITIDKTHYLL